MKDMLGKLKNTNYLKNRKARLVLLALLFTLAFCVFVTATLFASSSYVPEDTVEELNYERSQVYVDGTGYSLDDNSKKQHKEEEEEREIIQQEDPKPQEVEPPKTYTPPTTNPNTRSYPNTNTYNGNTYRRPTYTPPRRTTPQQNNQNKQSKKKEKKEKKSDYEKNKEEVSEDPVIKITGVKKNQKVKGKTKKFKVKATSYDGDKITGSKLTVKMNGTKLVSEGDDTYVGDVIDGTNKIEVKAVDESGRSSEKTVKFKGITDEEPEEIGELEVVVTAEALGLDVVVDEQTVKIMDNEQLSDVVKRYFDNSDATIEDIGSGYFELGRINKDGIIEDIPEEKLQEFEENGIPVPDDKDSLGLNDFGPGSGWMYKVDGTAPKKYMSSVDPKDGSTVEIYYTVSGM